MFVHPRYQLREVMQAVDCCARNRDDMESIVRLVTGAGKGEEPALDREGMAKMLCKQSFSRTEAGRYFVALSLDEAESVRALLHCRSLNSEASLIPGASTAISLRNLNCDVLDSPTNFPAALPYQQIEAEQCFRYLNSDAYYLETPLNLLLRCLQPNACEARMAFFKEVIHAPRLGANRPGMCTICPFLDSTRRSTSVAGGSSLSWRARPSIAPSWCRMNFTCSSTFYMHV